MGTPSWSRRHGPAAPWPGLALAMLAASSPPLRPGGNARSGWFHSQEQGGWARDTEPRAGGFPFALQEPRQVTRLRKRAEC